MMEILFYQTPAEFLEDNREFLKAREAAAQLNYGNAFAHREERCHPGLLFGKCTEGGRTVLLFGNTAPWNLCLNAEPSDPGASKAASLLAARLKAASIPISGVNAADSLCDAFLPAYGGRFHLRTAMDIMVLKEVKTPPAVPGRLCAAEKEDLPLLTQWGLRFHQEVTPEAVPDPQALSREMDAFLEEKSMFLFKTEENRPVCMLCASRKLPHGVCLSYVYTPEAYRGKGFCQNAAAALCRKKLQEGNDYCTLFVDRKNPASNQVYTKIGFAFYENCCDYHFEEEDAL